MIQLNALKEKVADLRTLPELPWLDRNLNGGLREGGAYLLSGEPGANKTTLAVQVAFALASQGGRILMVLNEQSPSDLLRIFGRVHGNSHLPKAVRENITIEQFDTPSDLLSLVRRRLPTYHPGFDLLITDSLQGNGLQSTATASYREFYEFLDETKSRGLTTLTIAHVTKNGRIAGPKSLEHKVDVCLVLRKAASLRHLYVPKNRFGPEVTDPVMLENATTGLILSPHCSSESACVLGYLGLGDLIEVQVAVSLPRYGARAELNAPFLPTKRIRQIISTLNRLPGLDLNDLSYAVNALVPDVNGYNNALDLPLAIAILAAHLQQAVPGRSLFIGGLDLRQNIRPPAVAVLTCLAELFGSDNPVPVNQIFLSSAAAGLLHESLPAPDKIMASNGLRLVGVSTLGELVGLLWPKVFSKHEKGQK